MTGIGCTLLFTACVIVVLDVCVCVSVPGGLYPGGVYRWRQRGGAGGGGDRSDDGERLLQGSVSAEYFLPVLLLLW